MSDSEILQTLKQQGKIWSGKQCYTMVPHSVIPTGYPKLDAELPGGGWPVGAVVEILYPRLHIGELRLVLPALKHQSKQDTRWQVWLNPPETPHGPGLMSWGLALDQTIICPNLSEKELSWAMDQCVQHNGCSVLLVWIDYIDPAQLRRLQLASENRRVTVFLFRPIQKSNSLSHASLKLQIHSHSTPELVRIDILKRRPGWPIQGLEIEVPIIGPEWN